MDLGLKGKVAMVAGPSKGLGFSVACALAQEGALVSMVSRDSAAIAAATGRIEKLGGGVAFGFTADVRSAEGITHWYRATVARLGPAELLVTDSGRPPAGPTASFDHPRWQRAVRLLPLRPRRMARK